MAPHRSEELRLGNILIKDESRRVGLPAYKILGESWAVYRTVTRKLCLPSTTSLEELRSVAEHAKFEYYTGTDGNWRRAVARMASMLGAKAHVYVPKVTLEITKNKIADEGGKALVVNGDYDQVVGDVERVSIEKRGLFKPNMAWSWYQEIPQLSGLIMSASGSEGASGLSTATLPWC